MNTQEKFQTALEKIADECDLDLVVEPTFANSGWYSFQPRAGFEPVLRFAFHFQIGRSSFRTADTQRPPGLGPTRGAWTDVRGEEHEQVLARVRALLDGEPDTVRIVVLSDGETFGPLEGSKVCEVPVAFDTQQIEEALMSGSLEGRKLR